MFRSGWREVDYVGGKGLHQRMGQPGVPMRPLTSEVIGVPIGLY